MIPQSSDRFYIFKFTIYISRITLTTTFPTSLRICWQSEHSSADCPNDYQLTDGQARIDQQLTLEDILKMDPVEKRFSSKQSSIVVSFVGGGKAAVCRVDLAELADGRDYNSVKTYAMLDCVDQNAQISMALVHVSSFEIEESEAVSFASIARMQVREPERQEDEPPVFGARQRRAITAQQPTQDRPKKPSPPNKSVSNKRGTTKSISPTRSVTSQRHLQQQQQQYQKFMKLLEGKDDLIQQLQSKIQQLMQNKKSLTSKCKQLQQQLFLANNNYKMLLAARDRLVSLPQERSAEFKEYRSKQMVTESDKYSAARKKGKSSSEERGRSQTMLKMNTKESEKVTEQIKVAMLEQENKMLKEEIQRSYQFQNQQKDLIKDLTQQLANKQREVVISPETGKALQEARDQAKQLHESLFKQKKTNILLQQQVTRLTAEVRRLQSQLNDSRRRPSIMPMMATSKIFNNQTIHQQRNDIKNQLMELKRSMAPRISLGQERFRAIQQQLKLKISQMRQQADQKQNQYKRIVSQKQMQISCLKDQLTLLTSQKTTTDKKLQSLTQSLSKQKQKASNNQRKIINFDRMQRKLNEIQKYNKQLQADYNKCDQQRRQKNETIQQMKAKIQERELEWTKLKRIEQEYKNLQEANTKMSVMNQRKERKLENLERKVAKLKETMIRSDGKVDQRAIREVEEQLRGKDKSDEIIKMEAEKKALSEESMKLKAKVNELENQVTSGLRSKESIDVLEAQKAKLQKQISNDIESKLRSLQNKLQQKRKSQRDQVQQLFKSKMGFSDNRIKMLQQQNQQLRKFTKQLTQQILKLQQVRQCKNLSKNIAKKKQKQLKQNQQQFQQQIQKISDEDILKRSQQLVQKKDIRQYVEKLRKAYIKRIEYLKGELEDYQAREANLYEREKDAEMEEIREKTSEELRMLLKRNYDVSETEVGKMRERAKRVETLEAENQVLREKVDRAEKMDLKASYMKKSQYDQSLVQELQRREKDNRIRLHALQLQLQKTRFQKQNQKTQLQGTTKQLKRSLIDAKDSLQKQKLSNLEQLKSIIDDYNAKQQQMKKFGQQYEQAITILQREVLKREEELKDRSAKLGVALKECEELKAKYNEKVAVTNEISQKAREQQEQVKKLMEIIQEQDAEKAVLLEELENVKKETQALFEDQKYKYEELDENSKQQIVFLQEELDRLQSLIEEEVAKSLNQDQQNCKLKAQLDTYKHSIEQLYEAELNNQAKMEQLKAAQQTQQMEKRIIQQEYEKLLKQFGQKLNQLNQVKNKYVSLQILLARSQQFIKKLQCSSQKDRQQFQFIFAQMQGQKLSLSNQLQQLTKTAIRKQQQYLQHAALISQREQQLRRLVEEFKFQADREMSLKNDLQRELEEVRDENGRLKEEAEVLKEMRKDNQRRRGKRYLEVEPGSAMRPEKSAKSGFSRQDSKDYSRIEAKSPLPVIEVRSPMPRGIETPNKDILLPVPSERRINLSPPDRGSELGNIRAVTESKPMSMHLIKEEKNRSPSPPSLHVTQQPQHMPSNRSSPQMLRLNSQKHTQQQQQVVQQIGHDMPSVQPNLPPPVVILDIPDITTPNPIRPVTQQQSQPRQQTYQQQSLSDKDSYQQLNQKVSQLQQQLIQKQSMIAQLQRDNSQLKQIYHEKIDKKTKITGGGMLHGEEVELEGGTGASHVLQRGVSQEVIELKCRIKELEVMVEREKAEKEKYAGSIREIHEEYERLEQEATGLREELRERARELKMAQEKELEYIEEQRNAEEVIREKEGYIAEFEELVENYNSDKEGLENMLKELQAEYEQKMDAEKRARDDIDRLTEQLQKCNDKIEELEIKLEELTDKYEVVTGEYTSYKSASEEKITQISSQLKNALIQIKAKDQNLEDLAQRYVEMEDKLEQEKDEFGKLEIRLQEKSHKYEQSLLKASSLEKQVNLALLSKKEFEQKISDITKDNRNKQLQKNKIIDDFIASLKRMQQEKESLCKVISERDSVIEQKDLQNYALKKDIEVFNSQIRKIKRQNADYVGQLQVYEQQIKQIIQNYESQLEAARVLAENTQIKNRQLYDILKQHQGQVGELQKIDRIRQDMFHELQRKHKLLQSEYNIIHQKLTNELNQRMAAALRELNNQHQSELQTKIEQLQFLKGLYDQQQSQVQRQRALIFQHECALQRIKHEYTQDRKQFESKIKRYESEVCQLSHKFRQMEKQRPTVQLYEQLAFQNEIFKGRISQLQQNMTYKQQLSDNELLQQFEYFKAKKQRERDQFLAELENYSSQVNDLEEKNYQLVREIEALKVGDLGRVGELEEENERLEKELIRLEDSEEELKRELKSMKARREEDMRRHYSQLQALRQRS